MRVIHQTRNFMIRGRRRFAVEMPVDAYLVPGRSTQQVVDGNAQSLAFDVPERHVDTGNGAHNYLAGRPKSSRKISA